MKRLIDADLLIERIRSNDDLPWNLDKVAQTAFESCVRHSSTAYDVDKVISGLKSKKFGKSEHYLSDIHAGFDAGIECAIEIVKKGGIE